MIPTNLTLNSLGNPMPQSVSPTNSVVGTSPGQTLTGEAGVDNAIISDGGGSILIGGGASDTFYVRSNDDQVIVAAVGGIDTIVSWTSDYRLPANVQNLIVQDSSGGVGVGNNLNNLLVAEGTGDYTLVAGTGSDVLVGNASGSSLDTGGGMTRFVISLGDGNDVISNFVNGTDLVQLDGFTSLTSFAAVQSAMTQVGSNVVLNLGSGQTLTFANQTISNFTAGSFQLPAYLPSMTLSFNSNFNDFVTSPNGTSGWDTTGGAGWRTLSGNNESEYYSDSSVGVNPFSVNNGILTITAAPGSNPDGLPYYSGIITTDGSYNFEYGYVSVTAELPAGAGMWPAFWLLPSNLSWPPEIDIMEMLGSDPNTIYVGTHSAVGGPNVGTTTPVYVGTATGNTATGFNTYAVDWEPNTITWYYDGTEIFSEATPADMHQPMYFLANLAVGGTGSWPGAPTSASEFPATLQISSIQVYASPNTVAVSGSAALTGGSPVTIDGTQPVTQTGTTTPPPASTAVVSGEVFVDASASGLLAAGDAGLAGVTVALLNGSGVAISGETTTTAANGTYSFAGLAAGTYEVQFTAPAGYVLDADPPSSGSTVGSAANPATGDTAAISLATGQTVGAIDAGVYAKASISGEVWRDANANGLLDSGETGIGGATVELLSAGSGAVLQTATTTTSGSYAFTNLTPGTYEIEVVAPSGLHFSPESVAGGTASSVSPTTGISAPVTVASAQSVSGEDAGLYATATIGGLMWLDTAGSGLYVAGDSTVSGATVELLNAAGTSVLATTTTSASGSYSFANLTPGSYEVKFVAPSGLAFSAEGVAGGTNSAANPTTGITAPITVTSGQSDGTVDAGVTAPQIALSGWGQTVTEGTGSFNVGGNGSGAHVTLGAGNDHVTVTGSNDVFVIGAGNEAINLTGANNTVTTGAGTSSITINGAYAVVSVGATASGTTTIAAIGYDEHVTSTGAGNVTVSGSTGGSVVSLGNGNQNVTIGGSGNTVTVGVGTSNINGGIGQDTITAAGGADTFTVTGYNNILNAGPGMNFLNGGSGNDTFDLNGAGQGLDTITGFTLNNSDVLNLARTIASVQGTVNLTNIGNYLTAIESGSNTTLYIAQTAHGAGSAFATLVGVDATVTQLVASHALVL
jgi:beta-glucanase (GH16 family)